MSDTTGQIVTVTHDGFQISSNEGTAEEIKANLEANEAPLDGTPEEAEAEKAKKAKAERSKAAAELGKAGGKAAAEARQARQDDLQDEGEGEDEETPKKAEAKAPEDEEEPIKGNPRRDAKARIQQLARERAAERARADAAEAKLAEMTARANEVAFRDGKAPTPPHGLRDKAYDTIQPTRADARPTPDQYETYEDYVEHLTEWKMEQRIQQIQQEQEEAQRTRAHADSVVKKVETFNERVTKDPSILERVDPRLLELKPSFTLAPGSDIGPANILADELVESEMGPQLMLYLTENEAEVVRILRLPNPREIARAVAKLEDKLGTEAPAPPKASEPTVSRAHPPVRPVTTSPVITDEDLDADNVDFDKWYRVQQARERRR